MEFFPRIFALTTAIWLIADMILDGFQSKKYIQYSPSLYPSHEANTELHDRMSQFCWQLKELDFNISDLNYWQNYIFLEWTGRCENYRFNITSFYGLRQDQLEVFMVMNIPLEC